MDSVVAGFPEYRIAWTENDKEKEFKRIDDFNTSKELRNLIHIANPGLCCITYPNFIRNNYRIGGKIGIHEIDSQISFLRLESDGDLKKIISLKNHI